MFLLQFPIQPHQPRLSLPIFPFASIFASGMGGQNMFSNPPSSRPTPTPPSTTHSSTTPVPWYVNMTPTWMIHRGPNLLLSIMNSGGPAVWPLR